VSEAARAGIPFVVAAPSGTGKTTVCKRLVSRDPKLAFSVSHTTRASRDGEIAGRDYHFVTPSDFTRLVAEDAFLEWAEYNGNRYGTSFAALDAPRAAGRDVLLEIEVQGARQVRRRLAAARFIFIYPPSLAELRKRLEGRATNTREDVEKRMRTAEIELAALGEFDYAVENDEIETCVARVAEILSAERGGDVTEIERVRRRYDPSAARRRFAVSAAEARDATSPRWE
jgi:guanylate kinase